MALDSRVLNWLYSVLTNEYHYVHETLNDISRVLGTTGNLSPRTDVYTSHDGVSKLLLCLSGTLPIDFLGISYQFPVKIWIPHIFPREPPLVYVTPREGMVVRPGQHVDPQGQVYHPYLSNWARFWDKSSLVDLVTILIDIFTKEPPVVATTRQEDRCLSTENHHHEDDPASPILSIPSFSPPPLPPRVGLPINSPYPSTINNQLQAPPLPLKTGLNHDQAYNAPSSHGRMSYEPMSSHDIRVQLSPEEHNSGQYYRIKSLHDYGSAPVMTSLSEQPHHEPPCQVLTSYDLSVPAPPPSLVRDKTTSELLRQSPLWQISSTHLIDEPGQIDETTQPTPPPVPLNPHKQALIRELLIKMAVIRRSGVKQDNIILHGIAAQREAMLTCETNLQAEMQRLSQLSIILESNTSLLHHALEQADITMSNSRDHPPPDIDDLLVAPTVVANQLYRLVAEDRAIEDTIFFVSRSFEKGRISMSSFAKSTRTMSREWFLKKALIQKISGGMGLTRTSH